MKDKSEAYKKQKNKTKMPKNIKRPELKKDYLYCIHVTVSGEF